MYSINTIDLTWLKSRGNQCKAPCRFPGLSSISLSHVFLAPLQVILSLIPRRGPGASASFLVCAHPIIYYDDAVVWFNTFSLWVIFHHCCCRLQGYSSSLWRPNGNNFSLFAVFPSCQLQSPYWQLSFSKKNILKNHQTNLDDTFTSRWDLM